MIRIQTRCGAFRPIMSLGLIVFAVFLAGCEVLATEGAREAIASQREVRALEDQELGPLERELDDLFILEIRPREAQIEDLHYQLQLFEETLLRPLWDAQNDVWAPGGEASEAQLLFEGRYRELDLLQRSIEIEQRELDSKWQNLWATGATVDPEFQALEDLRYEKQRELERLHRFGYRPIEDIWNEINELHSTQNWGNTDSQIKSEEINVELRRLYDRYTELQNHDSGEGQLLEERARAAQDELNTLHDRGWNPIYKINAEIERLESERAGRHSTAGNDESIMAQIAELERQKASYVESRDAEVASLLAALAALEEEASGGDKSTMPSDDNSARIAELELLIADLEAQSIALVASIYFEIDSLTVQIDEVNASYAQLIADATAEFQALSDSLLAQAAAVGVQIDELIADGGDDALSQVPPLQAQKDGLIAQEGTERAALDATVIQLNNDQSAAVAELQSLREVFEAEASSGPTDAIDAQAEAYRLELDALWIDNEGTVVLISNTPTAADIQANIEATEDYWNGLINEADIRILELQSQLGSITIDDSTDARIKNLQLQAAELELGLNARIADLEAFVNELYRQANSVGSGNSAGLAELQSQIDVLNAKLESIWRHESSNGLDILRHVQTLENRARALEDELQQKTRALEEELWVLEDRLSVYYRDQESGGHQIQVEYEAEMALLQQRRTDIEEQRWAIELEQRTVFEEIEANNAAVHEEIRSIEDGKLREIKTQIRAFELELRGFYATVREIEIRMDDARQLVEEKQRELEDNVLDLLEVAAGVEGDAPTDFDAVGDTNTTDGVNPAEVEIESESGFESGFEIESENTLPGVDDFDTISGVAN